MISTEQAVTTIEMNQRSNSIKLEDGTDLMPEEYKDLEQTRREYVQILQELKQKHPQYDRDTLETMAQEQLLSAGPKSRAFYRIQATRKILGGGNVIRKIAERTTNEVKEELVQVEVLEDDSMPKILFEPPQYTVLLLAVVFRYNYLLHYGLFPCVEKRSWKIAGA